MWHLVKQSFLAPYVRCESIKKAGVFHFTLYNIYALGETQILTDLSAFQNEELFH